MHASSAGFNVRLNGVSEFGPDIISSDEFQCSILSKVSGDRVVMFILQYSESEIVNVGDVDTFVEQEESVSGNSPSITKVVESG